MTHANNVFFDNKHEHLPCVCGLLLVWWRFGDVFGGHHAAYARGVCARLWLSWSYHQSPALLASVCTLICHDFDALPDFRMLSYVTHLAQQSSDRLEY